MDNMDDSMKPRKYCCIKRTIKDNMDDSRNNTAGGATDRISVLPESIIHHVMSFLPKTKDIVRTGVLSKRWKSVRASFPILDFEQSHFVDAHTFTCPERLGDLQETWEAYNKFIKNVDSFLLEFCRMKLQMKKFRLHIGFKNIEEASVVDKWLGLALENGVEEVDLRIIISNAMQFYNSKQCYKLPQSIFSTKSITTLILSQCNFKLEQPLSKDMIRFNSLQKLCLNNVHDSNELVQTLIHSCPLIEYITLSFCWGLRKLDVSGLVKLKEFVLETQEDFERIDMTPSLQSFVFVSPFPLWLMMPCPINIMDACKHLKKLKVISLSILEGLCNDLISKFPHLESLEVACDFFTSVKISSRTLKELGLNLPKVPKELVIDTPNLVHFSYLCDDIPISFMINAPCQWSVKLKFINFIGSLWFVKLREFLSKSSHVISLYLPLGHKITFNPEELTDENHLPINVKVEDLILEVFKSNPSTYATLMDGLLWCCQPKIVSSVGINDPENESLAKFLSEEFVRRDSSCCNSSKIKCWRHYLKDAKIEYLENGIRDRGYPERKCNIYKYPIFQSRFTRFFLEW